MIKDHLSPNMGSASGNFWIRNAANRLFPALGQSPAAADVAAVLRQSFCMEIPLLPEFRTPKASGTRLFKGWAALVEPEKLTMRIGDKVDLPPGVDRLPKSVSLKSWIGQIFLNPPPRPFQFIVFTASTDTYKRLRLTTGDRIHVCSLNSDFDLSVEEEIFRKHWDVLHSIPLAKWRDAAVLHERLLTGHSTAPDKDRQSLMSLVEKHPLLGDFLPSRPRVKSKEMLAMQYAAEAARATYDEKSDE